jgi:hypothetical protein
MRFASNDSHQLKPANDDSAQIFGVDQQWECYRLTQYCSRNANEGPSPNGSPCAFETSGQGAAKACPGAISVEIGERMTESSSSSRIVPSTDSPCSHDNRAAGTLYGGKRSPVYGCGDQVVVLTTRASRCRGGSSPLPAGASLTSSPGCEALPHENSSKSHCHWLAGFASAMKTVWIKCSQLLFVTFQENWRATVPQRKWPQPNVLDASSVPSR